MCQDGFAFQRKKADRKCGFTLFSVLGFSFLAGEGEVKPFRDVALGLSPLDTPPEFHHGFHVLLFADIMHHGSTGLRHQSEEDQEFRAGVTGSKVLSVSSGRKLKQLN